MVKIVKGEVGVVSGENSDGNGGGWSVGLVSDELYVVCGENSEGNGRGWSVGLVRILGLSTEE